VAGLGASALGVWLAPRTGPVAPGTGTEAPPR
jgi:hypothetical protein